MKLFVDDERPAPEGWTLTKTSLETIALMHLIRERGETLHALSLSDKQARPIVSWMIQHAWWPSELRINPGNTQLAAVLDRHAPASIHINRFCRYEDNEGA